jgi:hypothetical protein
MQLPVEATKITMQWPPAVMDRDERVLGSNEIAGSSSCTNLARRAAGQIPGVIIDSEQVSLSTEFGHIYRYNIMRPIRDEGKTYHVHSILVVWSKDCETDDIVIYPTFKLQGNSSPG